MNRSARLNDILQLLRGGDVHRAEDIAARFAVSVRTIYRDMDMLVASGVPIAGARGLGYHLTDAIHLPPIALSPAELEALNLGLAVVAEAADDTLSRAAETLADKIDVVRSSRDQAQAQDWQIARHPFADPTRTLIHLPVLRAALKARQKVRMTYTGRTGIVTSRTIRPLHLEYFGRVWTLTAWCELRVAFRVFRLDQIESTDTLPQLFADEPGKTLADFTALDT